MKNLFAILVFSLITISATAGEFDQKLTEFNTITVAGNFEVFLTKGDELSCKVVNTDADLEDEQIEFIQKGSELKITTKGNSLKKMALKIHITYTTLLNVNAKNGGWVEVKTPMEGEEIELSCTTDGVIHTSLACKNVKASIFTGGTIRLSGTADIAEYKVSTGGFISGKEVEAKSVTAKVSTGGDISCQASESMELKVNTGGGIKYIYTGDLSNFKEKVTLGGSITKFGGK